MDSRAHSWRRGPALAMGLALGWGLLAAPTATGKADDCLVSNAATPAIIYSTLQSAVDAAVDGDTLQVDGTCVGTTTITKGLTIAGGHKATLDGDHVGRVLEITTDTFDASVTLVGLRIVNGATSGDGGGILHLHGTLTLVDTVVSSNVAGGEGGGIGGELGVTLIDSKVEGNRALAGGGIGGIGDVTLVDSAITDNLASYGGGIAADHGFTTLNGQSTISANLADSGGGISSVQNVVVLNDWSSVRDNAASGHGGGILSADASVYLNGASSIERNTASGDGGGVYSQTSWVVLTGSSSISRNAAGSNGGGVANADALPFASFLWMYDASSIDRNSATNGGGIYNGPQDSIELQGAATVQRNVARDNGGGIWNATTAEMTDATGGGVTRNRPDDVFMEP